MINGKITIAISSGWYDGYNKLNPPYVQSIIDAGAMSLIIPVTDNESLIEEMLSMADGVLITGGGDFDPKYWGEEIIPQSNTPSPERDVFDLLLVKWAYRLSMPVLGICRGMQAINIAFGGTVIQDIYTQLGGDLLNHSQKSPRDVESHSVSITKNSLLHNIVRQDTLMVNSFHHQAVGRIADNCIISAVATDGVVEAIEMPFHRMVAVQWHPEELYKVDEKQLVLYQWLIAEAKLYSAARQIHQNNIVVDSHTDTPMVWTPNTDLGVWNDESAVRVDFKKMNTGGVGLTFMMAYLPQYDLNAPDYKKEAQKAFDTAVKTFTDFKNQVDKNPNMVRFITSPDMLDAPQCCKVDGCNKIPSVCFGLENGFALNGNIDNVDYFYNLGVRYITLCHNGDNDLCDSAKGNNTHGGLSDFGVKVVQRMNELGMIIDVSHTADSTIRDVLKYSNAPIVATHTSCRELCSHVRNMPDDLIKALAKMGGVMQICLYNWFLANDGNADLDTIINHICHTVDVAGINAVGIGSDFDGGGGVPGCNHTAQLINITIELLRKGFSTDDVAKIMGANFLNVWKSIINSI